MAEIVPKHLSEKTKSELIQDVEILARYVHKLRGDIEDEQAQTKLVNAKLIKARGDILKLKSMIGHQNIHISDLVSQIKNIEDIEEITYEETN